MTPAPFRGAIRLECRSEAQARAVAASLEPDNQDWAECRAEDHIVIARVETADLASLLRAADDLLACAQVALGVSARSDAPPERPGPGFY